MKKKILALLITVVMTAGMLAGCGSANQPADNAPAANTEAPAEDAETPAGDAEAATEDAATGDAATGDAAADTGSTVNTEAINNLIAATTDTVKLTVWASEEDQDLTQSIIDSFQEEYKDVKFDIQLGKESESKTKDDILMDIEAAPDVFAFADDQITELCKAGALQEVAANYTYDVKGENVQGSIDAASFDGKLYAYPMTADNGYFMFYDKTVFTNEEDVQSLDKMIEVAKAAGKKIAIPINDAWYLYSFFQGAGYTLSINEDQSNTCTWNADGAVDVAQSIIDLCKSGVIEAMKDEEQATALANGKLCAAINGTWRASDASKAWGDGYAATKLPTFTVAGEQVQMASFSGYKLVGVSTHSKNVGWSMLLAEYLTNESAQVSRFEGRGLGPSNIKAASSDAVQKDPAIAALAAQMEFATVQRVGGKYWEPAATLGDTLVKGNPDGKDLQALLDEAVAGITAPVE